MINPSLTTIILEVTPPPKRRISTGGTRLCNLVGEDQLSYVCVLLSVASSFYLIPGYVIQIARSKIFPSQNKTRVLYSLVQTLYW